MPLSSVPARVPAAARAVPGLLAAAVLVLVAACAPARAPSTVPAPARPSTPTSTPTSSSTSAPSAAAPPAAPPAAPRALGVVALGDSVTSGGPCGCLPFPQRYGRMLARDRGLVTHTENLGRGGEDTTTLLRLLRDPASAESRAVRGADVVLLTIGANDFADEHESVTGGHCLGGRDITCVEDDLGSMVRNLTAIVREVHRLRGPRPTAVLATGYWNVFEDGTVARRAFPETGVRATRRLTRLANAGIRNAADTAGATYVDLYAPFEGPATGGDPTALLGPDGDHPNAAGQALIARRLVAAGLPGLVRG